MSSKHRLLGIVKLSEEIRVWDSGTVTHYLKPVPEFGRKIDSPWIRH